MKKYKVPVYWTMYGVYEIEAETFKEAAEEAATMDLPSNGEYVSDSIELAADMIVELNNTTNVW